MDIYEECETLKEEIKSLKAILQEVKAERDHYRIYIPEYMKH